MILQHSEADVQRAPGSQPHLYQHGQVIQEYGTLRLLPIALAHDARLQSCQLLNQILADTMILYSLYKKHHWQMRGVTFEQLHLLLDKHADEQLALVDMLAERIQMLGGVAIAEMRHVAELTRIERPPSGVEEVPAMLSRLLSAHEAIITDEQDHDERRHADLLHRRADTHHPRRRRPDRADRRVGDAVLEAHPEREAQGLQRRPARDVLDAQGRGQRGPAGLPEALDVAARRSVVQLCSLLKKALTKLNSRVECIPS